MRKSIIGRAILLLATCCLICGTRGIAAQRGKKKQAPSAGAIQAPRPMKFDRKVLELFFKDAREALGPEDSLPKSGDGSPSGESTTPADDSGGPKSGGEWANLISAESIESEVKSQLGPIKDATKTPSVFKGGGNRETRKSFSELALLFQVIAEYPGEVRWKKDAQGLRKIFAQAGRNSSVGTDNSFKEAQRRVEDLESLFNGGKLELSAPEPDIKWNDISQRPPLMGRLQDGYDGRIKVFTADQGALDKNKEILIREAQFMSVIARVIQDESYEFGDDETYKQYAASFGKHAQELVEGAKEGNLQRSQSAAGELYKSCNTCHENYRTGG